MSSTPCSEQELSSGGGSPCLAALFWYYTEPQVCVSRVRRLRALSPHMKVFGLYGGALADLPAFADVVAMLDDHWVFEETEDKTWKWRNGDAMLAAWFAARGTALIWDSIIVVQWDLFLGESLTKTFGHLSKRDVLLPGLQPISKVADWWSWIRPGSVEGGLYERSIRRFQDRGLTGEVLACQFVFGVLPREFLSLLVENLPEEVGFLEYTLPSYARLFGFTLQGAPALQVVWSESPGKRPHPIVLSTDKSTIDSWVIAKELLRPRGSRLFHPVSQPYRFGLPSVVLAALRERVGRWRRRIFRPALGSKS